MPESSVSVMMLVHLIQTGEEKKSFSDEIFILGNTFSVILVIVY